VRPKAKLTFVDAAETEFEILLRRSAEYLRKKQVPVKSLKPRVLTVAKKRAPAA